MSVSFTKILHMARSGMLSRLLNLDICSNNLTNVNTTGFKRTRANFQELLQEKLVNGTELKSTQRLMDQGALRQTDQPLDLAIMGEGFFKVKLPNDDTAYTRDGEFRLDADRQIVNASGYALDWQGQIPEDATDINVAEDGTVWVLVGGEWQEAGNIELVTFPNPSGLQNYGQNLYLETEISGEPQSGAPNSEGFGKIVGKSLEQSNVNLAEEMTQMIVLQRSFEICLRTFQDTDQMLYQAIHMRRG